VFNGNVCFQPRWGARRVLCAKKCTRAHAHACTRTHTHGLGAGRARRAAQLSPAGPAVVMVLRGPCQGIPVTCPWPWCSHPRPGTSNPRAGASRAPWARRLQDGRDGPCPYWDVGLARRRAGSQRPLRPRAVGAEGWRRAAPLTAAFADRTSERNSGSQLWCRGWQQEQENAPNEPVCVLMTLENTRLCWTASAWPDCCPGSLPKRRVSRQPCPCWRGADSACGRAGTSFSSN